MVEDGAFNNKIDYVTIFKEVLNLEAHSNCFTGSKVTGNIAEWMDFAYWWSFSGEGSTSEACAADLFYLLPTMCEYDAKSP